MILSRFTEGNVMTEIHRLERIVNVVIGKPVTLMVYLLWQAMKRGCRGVVRLGKRLGRRRVANDAS